LDSVHYVLHRDVAARNFLVTRQSTVKLADFGRARYVYDDDYEASSAELISIKWAAPEASQEVFIGIYWHHAACGTRSMVCEMVLCPFVCPSVCLSIRLSQHGLTAANPPLPVCCCGPGGQ